MIKLGKCNGSSNLIGDLCTKICVLSETKDMNVEVFNVITKINEVKMFHAILNANSTVQHVIQN